ncbi:hypothetical protein L596_018856 [Steinernema carpocapsae]|uniref:non-specific serine/threonine protein kinase n=1 Tax=Steinernema carpocapsae TaxID=34508 RepID=A0A4U5N6D8_STECR|nr:hypothetical protein L596_018856 [Steinernema carpocapsae]
MPPTTSQKPGSLKDPNIAALFNRSADPESRYEDLREIGHGSFGAVFYALDKETNETVAIKKMGFSGKQATEKWSDICKEVSFLKNIQHRNIVGYKTCYLKEHTCWLVMEYCIGSASDILEVHKKPLLESEIAAICDGALSGLVFLHEKKRIHRDIKAGNILLTDTGIVKLADVGSASMSCPAQSFVGTPYWIAPEVILSMDEGQYDTKADIWSLGITCIELAERRPPLFNMNAMSALYHIAQNEAPGLGTSNDDVENGNKMHWSEKFRSFVDQCLRKDPSQRMSTMACRTHAFITEQRSPTVILDLIARTKGVVRKLDNFQYRKMRKLMYLDEQQCASASTSEVCSLDSRDDMEMEEDDEISTGYDAPLSLGGGGCDSVSSHSNSLRSFQSSERTSSRKNSSRPPIPAHLLPNASAIYGTSNSEAFSESPKTSTASLRNDSGEGPYQNGEGSVDYDEVSGAKSNRTIISVGDENGPASTSSVETSAVPSFHRIAGGKEDVATLRRSKFSTLRTTKLISREVEEYKREDNLYEQMCGYKRLRQQHHKELKIIEEKCSADAEAMRARLDREYEQLKQNLQKEQTRVRNQQTSELEKKARENEDSEKKLRKHRGSADDQQFKAYCNAQKKEYKHNKDRLKAELKSRNYSKSELEQAYKVGKANLLARKNSSEERFQHEQKEHLRLELQRVKRSSTEQYNSFEDKLLNDELNVYARQIETCHGLLRRHHELTSDMELNHLREIHQMKKRHMEIQHDSETTNQKDYNRRATDEMKKKHAMQSKQQPRELKSKEAQIRKQFRQAVKTQTRQFKAYQTHLLNAASRDEQKDLSVKLKEEQKRKIATLAAQYESTIESMVQDQTVKLESWQEDEAKQLSEKLTKELELLSAFQSRQKISLENQCERERVQLTDRIARRKAVLDCRIDDEMKKFEEDRAKQLNVMRARHAEEIALLNEDVGRLTDSVSQMNLNLNSPSSNSSCQFATSSKRHSFSTITNL